MHGWRSQAVYSILPYYLGNFVNEIKENPAVSAYFEAVTVDLKSKLNRLSNGNFDLACLLTLGKSWCSWHRKAVAWFLIRFGFTLEGYVAQAGAARFQYPCITAWFQGKNISGVFPPLHTLTSLSYSETRGALWCRFQDGCVPLGQWGTSSSSSSHKTILPSHNKFFSCTDSEGYWSQPWNLPWLGCYYFPCTLWPTYSMKWCLCVVGEDLPLFLCDLSYATQVIQHAKPTGGLECAGVRFCRSIASSFFFLKSNLFSGTMLNSRGQWRSGESWPS